MTARDARADAGVARVGGRGGGIGEDAEVDIAQRAQLGLKHDVLAGLFRLIEVLAGVADIGRELRAELLAPGEHVLKLVGFRAVDVLDGQVLPLEDAGQPLFEVLRVQELTHHDGLLLILVGIDRRDAAQRGAVFLVLQTGLFQTVQRAVIGEDDGRAVGDLEVFRRDADAGLLQGLDLAAQALEVDDDAVAEDVHDARQADAGGDEMQGKFAVFVDDGVARVVAALIPADDVIFLCDPALALVAPVDAYDRTVAHNAVLLIRFFTQFLFYFSFLADYMPFSVLCKCVFRNVSDKINL